MHPHVGFIEPNPAISSGSYSSRSTQPLFPSTVILEHNMNYRKGKGAKTDSSDGTGPTFIETSPLSAEPYDSDTELRTYKNEPLHQLYNSSCEKITVKTKNKKKISRQSSSNYDHQSGAGANDDANIYRSRKKSSSRHVETISRRMDPCTDPINVEHMRHDDKPALSHHHDTLTWRMDPSVSLSDFTLTVIGIDDKIAIKRYLKAKKKRKDEKTNKRRKDKWMVEGLYLDMSRSFEDDERHDDGQRDKRDKDYECDQEYQSDDIQLVHSTISGTKTSKYPVVEKYHLHKVNLAVGARNCDYFARLFQKKGSSRCKRHSLELPLSCLPAIPDMLDYLYNPDQMAPVHATTATAIPLRYLGKLLGNHSLFDSATQFLHMDLRPDSAIEYLQHADLYHQEKLAEVCIRVCAENFNQLKITWFASLAPHLMKKILHSKYFTHSINSQALCTKIASYFRCQLHKIDREMLLSLTNAKVMPRVSPEEALFFIQMMIRLGMDMEDHNGANHMSAKERILYERCIAAAPMIVPGVIDSLCKGDNAADNGFRDAFHRKTSDYSSLPPQVKVDLLEYALAKQKI